VKAIYREYEALYPGKVWAKLETTLRGARRYQGSELVPAGGQWAQNEQPEAFDATFTQVMG
jgi:hypothetical protein